MLKTEKADKTIRIPLKVFLIFAFAEMLVLVFLGGFCWLQGQATGIALGYEEAAARAIQMNRPIPDTIFEHGPYRVAVRSLSSNPSEPFRIHIAVRERITNATFYESERRVEILR